MKAKRAVPFVPLAVCALLAAGFANGAHAQAGPAQTLLDGKVVGNLGGFIVGTDFKASLNGESANNPEVDFDKTFGDGSDQTRIRADLLWRITPNHHLRFLYFDDSTTRKRVIDADLAWGDNVFTAGGEVKLKTSLKIAELAYEYAFIRQPTFELNGSLGVHWMDVGIKLSGDAIVTDSNGNSTLGVGLHQEGRRLGAAAGDRPSRRLGGRAECLPRRPGAVLQGQHQRLRRQRVRPACRGDVDVHAELRPRRRLQPVQHSAWSPRRRSSTAASRSATRASRCS